MMKYNKSRKWVYGYKLIEELPDGTLRFRVVKNTEPAEQSRRRIVDRRKQFMVLYNQGLSDGKIGKVLGFSKSMVCFYRRKLGLPAHFKFGTDKIVFSEEEKEKIVTMRSNGASISSIAKEFGVNMLTMLKRCKEMGVDTSRGALSWNRREKEILLLWGYLEDHGPMTQREVTEKLNISRERLCEYMANLQDIFERFKFSVGTGSGSRGGIKYGGYEMYGGLGSSRRSTIISHKNDPRLIDYIVERMSFKIESSHDAQTVVMHFKKHIGTDRAQEVVKRMGYVYRKDRRKTPKRRKVKFTDEQLIELYDENLSDSEISKRLGVTPPAVCTRRRRLGLSSHYKGGRPRKLKLLDELDQIERVK